MIEEVVNAESSASFDVFVWNWELYRPRHLEVEGSEATKTL
jgi:hypothetical protein